MKQLLLLFTVAFAAAAARADLVMQQQIIAPNYTGVTTMTVKGSKVRLDLFAGEPQAMSKIMDLNTGETISLLHSQKLFVKTSEAPNNQTQPAGGANASKAPVAHATGKTQKVGEYDTELYTWSNTRGITGTAWVAKNFPDYARIRTDIAVLDRSTGDGDTSPMLSTLPGMVVRSEVAGSGQTITLALISAKEGPLDSSLFGVPRNYKELPQPKPLKTVVATQPAPQKPAGNSAPTTSARSATPPAPPVQKLPSW